MSAGPKLQHHHDCISSTLAQYAVNPCEHHCCLGSLSILPYNGALVHFTVTAAQRRDGIYQHRVTLVTKAAVYPTQPRWSMSVPKQSLISSPLWLLGHFFRAPENG